MGSAIDRNLSGFIVPHALFTYGNRYAADITATEADPRPGSFVSDDARSKLVPAVRGGQDTALDLYVTKSGNPGIGDGACRVIHKASAATLWRGYNKPHITVDWQPLADSTTAGMEYADGTRIPSTGKVVAVFTLDGGAVGNVLRAATWNPATGAWTGATIASNVGVSTYNFAHVACTTLPDERVIAFAAVDNAGGYVAAWSSDDAGATWSVYAEDVGIADFNPAPNASNASATLVGTDVLWVGWEDEGGTNTILQYASSDLGASFTLVRTWSTADATYPRHVSVAAMPDGRVALAYVRASASVGVRVVGSAWEAFEDADEVVVTTANTGPESCALVCDEDGTLILYLTTQGNITERHSADGGLTWTAEADVITTGTSADYPRVFAGVASMGRTFVLHNMLASTGTQDTLAGALVCGGWSEWETDSTASGSGRRICMIPYELPYNIGTFWTRTGSGGTWSLNTAGYVNLSTGGGGTADYVVHDYGATNQDLMVMGRVRVTAGGAVGTNNACVRLYAGDGAGYYRIELRFSFASGQFRWTKDSAGTTIDTVTWDWSEDLVFMMLLTFDPEDFALGTETVTGHLYYRAPDEETWTKAPGSGASVTLAAVAQNTAIEAGARVNTVATECRWVFLNCHVATAGTLYPNTTQTEMRGKPIGIYPFPLPAIGPDATVARLSLDAGPGILGDGFDIDPVADRPLANLYHDGNPSPSAPWRSTNTAEQVVMAWEADGDGAGVWRAWGIAVFGSNAAFVRLEGYNGATWDTIATAGQGAAFAVAFLRYGDMIIPNTTGDSGDRTFFRNELAGGWVDLGSGDRRKIRSNTAGAWKTGSNTGVAKMQIYLDGIDGTEASSGTVDIYAPAAVNVELNETAATFERFRVRIDSGNNADGYWQIGQIVAGPVALHGKQHSFGHQWQRALNAETVRARNGATLTRRLGTAPRSLTISWPEGVNMYRLRSGDPNYIAPLGGTVQTPADDVPFSLMGLIEEIRSGEIPVVFCPLIGTSGLATTDPTLFLYGRIGSPVALDHVLGDEGTGEVYRIAGVTIEEIV